MRAMHSNPTMMKLTIISILATLTMFVVAMWYTRYVNATMIHDDQFWFILDYEAWQSGELTWKKLWASKGGHRLIGYELIFLGNAKFFGFKPIIETTLAYLGLAFTCIVISRRMGRQLASQAGFALAALYVVFTAIVLFNAQIIYLSIYSLIAMRALNFAGFLLIAIWFYSDVFSEKKQVLPVRIIAYMSCVIFLLIFGRGWGMAAVIALTACLAAFSVFSKFDYGDKSGRILILPILAIVVYFLIYLKGLSSNAAPDQAFDLGAFTYFYFKKLGVAQATSISLDFSRTPGLGLTIGIISVVLSVLWSICLLFDRDRSEADWIAFFVIVFCSAACGVVTMSRYTGTPYFPRHNLEMSYILLGHVWFILKYGSKLSMPAFKWSAMIVTVFFGGCILYGINFAADQAKYLRNYHNGAKKKFAFVMYPDAADPKSKPPRCPTTQERCQDIYEIMLKYDITTEAAKEGRLIKED